VSFAWNGSRSLVTAGDSKTAQGSTISGSQRVFNPGGYQHHLNGILKQRLAFPIENNAGVGGDTSAMMLARYATDVVALAPGFVIVEIGTNDLTAGTDAATTIANIAAIIALNQAAGAVTILSEISCRSGWGALTAGQKTVARNKLNHINRHIREVFSRLAGVFVASPNTYWTDPASSTGDPASGYTSDGLHDIAKGAYYRALSYYNVLDPLLPPLYAAHLSPADLYDATDNPDGNLLTNGIFAGTGGTPGTGSSGTLASAWSFARGAGSTSATITAQARTDGLPGYEQVVDFAAVSGAAREVFELSQNVSSNYAAGDQLVGEVDIELSSSQNITGIALILYDIHTSTIVQTAADGNLGQDTYYYPTVAHSLRLRTPVLTPSAGTTAVKFDVVVFFNANVGAQTFTMKVRNASLRHVSA